MTHKERLENIIWGAVLVIAAVGLVIFVKPVSDCQDLITAGASEREILSCQYQSDELSPNNWFNRCMKSATKQFGYDLSLTLCVNGYYNYKNNGGK